MDKKSDEMYPLYITYCVFNALSAHAAIMLNIFTIHAIRKTFLLPKPLKQLLLSLAVSDLGVGLVVQPLQIGMMIQGLHQDMESNPSNTVMKPALRTITDVFAFASFFGVLAISVDRFLAIYLHLRYQELVSHKRVVIVTIFIWLFSVFHSLVSLWISSYIIAFFYIFLFGGCFICTTIVYLMIYSAVRRHTNQMQALQVQQRTEHDERTHFARLRKSAIGTFYVYIVFLICYMPEYCLLITKTIDPGQAHTTVYETLGFFSASLIFLNSSLNPVIYCWKVRHIRHAIVGILRNVKHSRGN